MNENEELVGRILGNNKINLIKESLKNKQLPLSFDETQFKLGVAIYYNLMSSLKIPNDDSIAAAINLMWFTIDFAEKRNCDIKKVQDDIASGLIGNNNAMYKYGINLDIATLRNRAYSLAIASVGTELSKQQKVLASYHELISSEI